MTTDSAVVLSSSSPTIVNTIVAFNSFGIYRSQDDGVAPAFRHNCVYGNTPSDYTGFTDPTGTNGNISADPLLGDLRYGNTHIQPDSPCVDAGNNADAFADFDIDGEPRIQGGTVEIGADESDGTVWPPGPYAIVRVSPAGDDANDGSSWVLAKRTVQASIDAAAAVGGEVWVQTGTYQELITLRRYASLYGGFAGSETMRDQRDWVANVTTLDGQRQGSVVTSQARQGASAIDGFTITNGSARYGGGLYLFHASPTIANNDITGNTATDNGGGLYLYKSSPMIANNTIRGNNAGYEGGGLCLELSFPRIANNNISGNSAARGGGLHEYSSSGTITNNTIAGNIARDNGGGLYLGSSALTIGNAVAFNSSGIHLSGTDTTRLLHNCVYGNTAYDYSGLSAPTGTDGNISADPLFIRKPDDGGDAWGDDPATPDVNEGANDDFGDLRLSRGSPCIDAGYNALVPPDTPDLDADGDTSEPLPFDLAGGPRFLDDPLTADTGRGTPPIVDIGALEHPLRGDCDGSGQVDLGDCTALVGCMAGPDLDTPAGCGCADMNFDGHADLRDFARFQVRSSSRVRPVGYPVVLYTKRDGG